MSDSLWPHELQHSRLPSLSLYPRVYPNSCPLSRQYHPTISSSAVPFSSCPPSFPASGFFFPVSRLFTSGDQNVGASASPSVLPKNIQGWFPLGLVWSPYCSRDSQDLLQQHSSKAPIFWCSAFFMVQFSHLCMTIEKSIALTIQTFVSKMMSLLFNMLSRFVMGKT